jgi:hypothetical protein
MLIKKTILATAVSLLSLSAFSQVQFGAFGSYSKGTGDNEADLWGGGAHLRFFMGKNIALGGAFKTYPKTSSEYMDGTTKYTSSDLLSSLTGTFDLLLAKNTSSFQPFIGADAGFSFSNQITTVSNNGSQSVNNENKQTFFMISPKAGLNIGLGKTFGLFGQAQYNMTFGSGDPENLNIGGITITSTPVDKYFSFDAGIYVRLVGAGKASD